MSGTHDCGGEAAAYVLGALDPQEVQAFRRHLEECVVCRDEVKALRGVVQALPMVAPQYPTPKRLRRRVMRAVRWQSKAPASDPRRRWPVRSRPHLTMGFALAAVVLVAAVGVTIGIELSGGGGGGGHVIQAQVSGISGRAQLVIRGGRGELIVRRLSAPPPGHVYEVWLKAPGGPPAPASVLFSVSPSGSADVGLPGSLHGISQVMVTPEPAGGSSAPTHSPVIVASLS